MKNGDKIRLVRVPPNVKDDREFKTRTMLMECVGRIFTIRGFQGEGGLDRDCEFPDCWLELDMGEAFPGIRDSIWVEPDCVELVKRSSKKRLKAN